MTWGRLPTSSRLWIAQFDRLVLPLRLHGRSGFATAKLLDRSGRWSRSARRAKRRCNAPTAFYKPSYALIYLGIADMVFYSEQQFEDNLTALLKI